MIVALLFVTLIAATVNGFATGAAGSGVLGGDSEIRINLCHPESIVSLLWI